MAATDAQTFTTTRETDDPKPFGVIMTFVIGGILLAALVYFAMALYVSRSNYESRERASKVLGTRPPRELADNLAPQQAALLLGDWDMQQAGIEGKPITEAMKETVRAYAEADSLR